MMSGGDTRVDRNVFMRQEIAVVHAAYGEAIDTWELQMKETAPLAVRKPTDAEAQALWPIECPVTSITMKEARAGYIWFPEVRIDVVWLDEPYDEKEDVLREAIKMVYARMVGKGDDDP